MGSITDQIEKYLFDTLNIRAKLSPWALEGHVPLFLQDRYRFFVSDFLNNRFLFIVDVNTEQEESPAVIDKHIIQIRSKWDHPVIYARDRVSAYHRKRLIERKVSFIVPGNQMYLPYLGIDLREHFKMNKQGKAALRPATQSVVLYVLLRDAENLCLTLLAKELGYSIMTMSRAFDELESSGLGQTLTSRRERHFQLVGTKRVIWDKAQPLLRTPVKKRFAIEKKTDSEICFPQTGLSALSRYSTLSEPKSASIAISGIDWTILKQGYQAIDSVEDEIGTTIVEIWNYNPALFADNGLVDRLSLYLSLRDSQDERVQLALEQMIRDISWLKD